MQSENKLFDDFVKMVNGFAGTMAGMGREAESSAREKMREWMAGSDFVGRDEYEILKGRIAALEARAGGAAAPAAKRGGGKSGGPKASPGA
jgi:BMFP domain-containing protein YqiC